jgi:hypothetical protein
VLPDRNGQPLQGHIHDLDHLFWVQSLADADRADDVGRQDGGQFALLVRERRRFQGDELFA